MMVRGDGAVNGRWRARVREISECAKCCVRMAGSWVCAERLVTGGGACVGCHA